MWLDDPEKSKNWMGPWSGLVQCQDCAALIDEDVCPICGWAPSYEPQKFVDADGREFDASVTMQGAIAWQVYLLLGMMQREWERPLHDDHWTNENTDAPSQRATVVMLFWTLFELLMERFFAAAMADYPDSAREDLLKRYGQIGARLNRLYRIVFGTTFWDDLKSQGDEKIVVHLRQVQDCRNAFMHGDPKSLNEEIVLQTIELLHETQSAWMRLFNRQCTGRKKKTPVWDVSSPKRRKQSKQ